MEYHSTIKSNEILLHAAIWMNLENSLLSKEIVTKRFHILFDLSK